MRVSLDETEQILKNKFENLECVCSGTDDKMCIFITDESKIESVGLYIHKKLNISKSAFKVKFIENITRTSSGKINYHCINEMLMTL